MSPDEIRSFLRQLARASGELIADFYGRNSVGVEIKSDATPVTEADRGAEKLLREMILSAYPHHGVIGEELGRINEDSDYQWVLDPIDGTKSFLHRVPLFVTLIGLMYRGRPIAGAIHQPITGMLCIGADGSTTLNEAPVRVRKVRSIQEASVLSSGYEFARQGWESAGFTKLRQEARMFRTWGDGYGYMLVASGIADIMLDPKMAIWDLAALIPVIEGAGGTITGWDGGDPLKSLSAVASCGEFHKDIIALLGT